MRRRWSIRSVGTTAAAVLAVALLPGVAQADAPPSACVECCEGDAVCEAVAALTDLRSSVDELIPQAGTAKSLDAKLIAAADSVAALNTTAALRQLDAFGHEVDALAKSGQLSASVSNVLKTKHDTAKNSVGNVR